MVSFTGRLKYLRRPRALLRRIAGPRYGSNVSAMDACAHAGPHIKSILTDERREFRTHADFREWIGNRPEMRDAAYIEEMAQHIRTRGVWSDWLGWARPDQVTAVAPNYRESVTAFGLKGRAHVLLYLLRELSAARSPECAILGMEAVTPLALFLRGRFPRYLGTEYAPDPESQSRIFPIPHTDAAAMPFPDASFHAILSGDVFEHVPDLDRTLAECARVLKPGGQLLATFPFACGDETSSVKAELRDGVIVHHTEPEYHYNPVDPAGGSLVFTIPAWDIVLRCRAAGFANAEMVFLSSSWRGFVGQEIAGLFALRATA